METAEIEKELEDLETRLERLRALYEQYFMGVERIEPQIPRKEVDRKFTLLRREQMRNTAVRFKFQTLNQRYTTMQQYWGRIVREIENGTFKRDVMKAAQRFGTEALTALGKKKTKALEQAAAKGDAKRPRDDELELGADDLIEDTDLEEVEDEAPTPPKAHHEPGPTSAPVVAAPVSAPLSAPAASAPASVPVKRAGLRWGSSDPSSAVRASPVDVKKRVAELAAGIRGDKAPAAAGFGSLDLDLEDSGAGKRAAPPAAASPSRFGVVDVPELGPPASPAARAQPAAAAPQPASPMTGRQKTLTSAQPQPAIAKPAPSVAPVSAPTPAPRSAPVSNPMTPASGPAVPRVSPFAASGPRPSPLAASVPIVPAKTVQSAPPAAPSRPAAATAPPAAPSRPAATTAPPDAPSRPAPVPAAAPSKPAAGAADELNDQRIRQIYAKYVETKRSTHESTAGVTYDKLAESLRVQAQKLKAAHPAKSVDYEVVVKDGKTHLKPVLR